MIKKWFNILKCFVCMTLLCSFITGVGGLYLGFKLGTSNVCEQAIFAYGNDMILFPCSKIER